MEELMFTPSAVLGLLAQIDELKDLDIAVTEDTDSVTFSIGESEYTVNFDESVDVEVSEDDLDDVDNANEEGYDIAEQGEFNNSDDEVYEPVEGGIIKELAKTLMIGGLVRLTSNAIKNS